MFSCEFCKIYENTFLTEPVWATASALDLYKKAILIFFVSQFCITLKGRDLERTFLG